MADLAVPRADRPAAPARTPSTGVDGAALWRRATWPLWAWSDVPAPEPPARDAAVPPEIGLAGEVFLSGLGRVRTRLWVRAMLHGVFRGAWLVLMAATAWMAWSLLAGGPALDLRLLGWAVGIGALAGLLFGLLSRPSLRRTAAMLDRTFGLRERLTTAVEDLGQDVPSTGEWARVPYLQMADSANAMDVIRRDRTLAVRLPVREIVMTVFWALALASLAFLRGVGGEPAALANASVPAFVSAAEAPVEPEPELAPGEQPAIDGPEGEGPTVEEVLERSRLSSEARQDLQALADALGDHAVTRPAADAISRGDYERAADALRDLAPNAGELSPQSRDGIASDLDAASDRMSESGSGLREASAETAEGLRQGDRDAREGLRSLAEAVEQAGDRVAPQSELAEDMRRAQQGGQQSRQAQAAPGEPGGEAMEGQVAEGQAGDPGEGADASGQPASGEGQQGEPGQQGQGQQGAGQQGQAAQGSGADGQAEGAGQGESGSAGTGDDRGDSAEAAQGGGAGSGEGDSDAQEGEGAAGGDNQEASQPAQGAPEQRVTEGDGRRGDAGEGGEVTETIALPPGQQGDGGVQTSPDGGSALLGTGAGVTAGSGSAVQGEVGESGPDSNHVPAEYRDLVQDYFSGQEGR